MFRKIDTTTRQAWGNLKAAIWVESRRKTQRAEKPLTEDIRAASVPFRALNVQHSRGLGHRPPQISRHANVAKVAE